MKNQQKEIQLPDEFSVQGTLNYTIEYRQEPEGIKYYVKYQQNTETQLVIFTAVAQIMDDIFKGHQDRKKWLRKNKKHKDHKKIKAITDAFEKDREGLTRAKYICGKIGSEFAESALHEALYKANEKRKEEKQKPKNKAWWKRLLKLNLFI